jgi:sugar phosphate isomerase/epimerase
MFAISVINIEISYDIEEALKSVHELGIEHIEIHSAWGKNIECLEDSELQELKRLTDTYNLKIPCISSTLFLRTYLDDRDEIAPEIKGFRAIFGDYKYQLKMLHRAFRAAEILDSPLVRVFPFQKVEVLTEDIFSIAAEKFAVPAKLAIENGFTLVMETCPHTSFGWGINATKLIQMIDSRAFKLLWDPAGSIRAGEPDCMQSISDIMQLAAHVHAKDILVLPNGGREYLAVGKGQLPWMTILQSLRNANYSGVISLEPHFRGQDGSKVSAIKESLEGLRNMLAIKETESV